MAQITSYPVDSSPSLNDKIIGTEAISGLSKNYQLGNIVDLVNGVAGKDYIQYKFSLTDHLNIGAFNTNESKTNPTEISKLFLNKQSTTKEDLSVLFNKLDTLLDIAISLRNPSDTNNFITFKITNITSHTTYFEFDVVLYKNFYSGILLENTIYSAYFDVKENYEDKLSSGTYTGTAKDLDDAKQNISEKGIANGYASLDTNGLVPASQLPSYVDDVLEFINLAAFPVTGATGKIYIAIDSSLIYRWSGTIYIEIKDTSAVWGAITGTVTNQTDLINWINLNVVAATFLGTIIPTDIPTGSGSAYWLATQAGTYTNFGGVVVNATSFAIISRSDSGAFSISQTTLDITSKVNVYDVVNNLTSSSEVDPVSALQAKILNEKIVEIKTAIKYSNNPEFEKYIAEIYLSNFNGSVIDTSKIYTIGLSKEYSNIFIIIDGVTYGWWETDFSKGYHKFYIRDMVLEVVYKDCTSLSPTVQLNAVINHYAFNYNLSPLISNIKSEAIIVKSVSDIKQSIVYSNNLEFEKYIAEIYLSNFNGSVIDTSKIYTIGLSKEVGNIFIIIDGITYGWWSTDFSKGYHKFYIRDMVLEVVYKDCTNLQAIGQLNAVINSYAFNYNLSPLIGNIKSEAIITQSVSLIKQPIIYSNSLEFEKYIGEIYLSKKSGFIDTSKVYSIGLTKEYGNIVIIIDGVTYGWWATDFSKGYHKFYIIDYILEVVFKDCTDLSSTVQLNAVINNYAFNPDFSPLIAKNTRKYIHNLLILGTSYSEMGAWIDALKNYIRIDNIVNVAKGGSTIKDLYQNRIDFPYTSRPNLTGGNQNVFACQVEKIKRLIAGTDLDAGETQLTTDKYPNVIILECCPNDGADTDAQKLVYENQFFTKQTGVYMKTPGGSPFFGNTYLHSNIETIDRTSFAGALRYLHNELHILFPDAKIYITTPSGVGYADGGNVANFMSTSESIRVCSQYLGIPVIDLTKNANMSYVYNSNISGSGTNLDPYLINISGEDTIDQIHPNSQGGDKIAKVVADNL